MKTRNRILVCVIALAVLLGASSYIYAFIGPAENPPGGDGLLIASSTRALGIATTTVYSTESQLLFKTLGGSNQHIIFSPNGYVGIATTTPSEMLYVFGNIGVSGNVEISGSFVGALSGSLSAANVSSEVFGRLQGEGNFAFPASLGVATSSEDGLPQSLSVYGGGYFSGSVGIGTSGPDRKLDVLDSGGTPLRLSKVDGTTYHDFTTDGYSLLVAGSETLYNAIIVGTEDTTRGLFNASGHGSGTTTGGSLYLNTSADYDATIAYYMIQAKSDDLLIGPSTDIDSLKYNGGTNDWAFTGTGNVGIGTASPGAKLEVLGGNIALREDDDGNDAVLLSADNTDGGFRLYSNGVEKVKFGSASDSYFLGGNVGIGTTTPASALTISGNLDVSGTITGASVSGTIDAENINAGNFGGGGGIWSFGGAAKLGIGTTTPSTALHVVKAGGGTVAEFGDSSSNPYKIKFTSQGGGAEVGISNTGLFTINITGRGDYFVIDDSANSIALGGTTGSVGIKDSTPDATLDIFNSGTENLSLRIDDTSEGDTTPFVVDSSGNVGIGTVLPGAILGLNRDTSVIDNLIEFEDATVNKAWIGIAKANSVVTGVADNDFVIRAQEGNKIVLTTASTDATRFVMDTVGNIGIGTVSPDERLEVHHPTGVGTIQVDSQSSDATIKFSTAGTEAWTIGKDASESNAFVFSEGDGLGGTPRVTFDVGGNVGIGTVSPASKLSVDGDGTFGSTGRAADTYVRALAGDSNMAGFEAYGSSQGTGYIWVGQLAFGGHAGGGIFYNGDGSPAFATGETADRVSFYRANTGENRVVVFSYPYSSNNVTFRGNLNVDGTGTNTIAGDLVVTKTYRSPIINKGNKTGAVTIDWSEANTQIITLIGNVAITHSNGQSGGRYTLVLKQDATGSRTATWANSQWGDSGTPTLSTGANLVDYAGFVFNDIESNEYHGIAFNSGF